MYPVSSSTGVLISGVKAPAILLNGPVATCLRKSVTVKSPLKIRLTSLTKAVVLSNGQKVSVKKSQAYNEYYKGVAFKKDEGNYGSWFPVAKDSNGNYIEEPEEEEPDYYEERKATSAVCTVLTPWGYITKENNR